MGLRTELSFRHGSRVRKNRADPCAALRLRAGESAQGVVLFPEGKRECLRGVATEPCKASPAITAPV